MSGIHLSAGEHRFQHYFCYFWRGGVHIHAFSSAFFTSSSQYRPLCCFCQVWLVGLAQWLSDLLRYLIVSGLILERTCIFRLSTQMYVRKVISTLERLFSIH